MAVAAKDTVDDVALAAGLALVLLPQADATRPIAIVAPKNFHLKLVKIFPLFLEISLKISTKASELCPKP